MSFFSLWDSFRLLRVSAIRYLKSMAIDSEPVSAVPAIAAGNAEDPFKKGKAREGKKVCLSSLYSFLAIVMVPFS
jgi:hypothetical protein